MTPRITSQLLLETAAFTDGDAIPATYTCDGEDESPEFAIGRVPPGTETLAFVVDDPDAPSGTFVHWLLWNVPADTIRLPRGVKLGQTVYELRGARQGSNGFGTVGYRGPCPPVAHGPHTYRFTLYACDRELDVPAGASINDLRPAIEAAQLDSARLTGTYERH
ncbi:YbhB/YbcL family Raf kinase inhibitor-like protein [Haloarchaeobius sp. TZWWS8]|uniref:YbhB/YbcL family Raf kinase inhibitor-like protein n=1 Tax=Haloarchaeobius sp. TZWWS8 TaxID=3446121 RepID=UPI003EBCB3BB